ncbi:MAG: aminoglycoside phosphotransferase/kinase family protein [Actinomycetes bacterium]
MLSDEEIYEWCSASLGSAVAEVVFVTGNLSRVIGVVLGDGREVVLKVRPWQDRLLGCAAVQRHLAADGFPCPALFAGPDQRDGWAASAEASVPAGEQLDVRYGAAAFAGLLHRLITEAPPVDRVPSLLPSPPWTGWDHPGDATWPARDDTGRDLNRFPGPTWVDRAAERVRRRLVGYVAPIYVGHGDWESQNIQWQASVPVAVHDWDSVIAQPEAAVVGLAAAVWPARGAPGQAATVGQTAEFIAAYERASGTWWATQDRAAAWAAGLWVRLFNAKKDAADGGGPQLDRLEAEITTRSERASLAR